MDSLHWYNGRIIIKKDVARLDVNKMESNYNGISQDKSKSILIEIRDHKVRVENE